MNEQHEFTGKTIDEAISEGLAQLGLSEQQVEITVLNKGNRGIFGIGSEPAQVQITPISATSESVRVDSVAESDLSLDESPAKSNASPMVEEASSKIDEAAEEVQGEDIEAPVAAVSDEPSKIVEAATEEALAPEESASTSIVNDDVKSDVSIREGAGEDIDESMDDELSELDDDERLASLAVELLRELVQLMGFDADVTAEWKYTDDDAESGEPSLILNIQGADLGVLIGRRGETLADVQYLLRLMVNQRLKQWKNIIVDIEQYKERRANQLSQLALRMAEQVAESSRSVSLEPMPSNERRIVHMVLRDHPDVYTESHGESYRRKIMILPKNE